MGGSAQQFYEQGIREGVRQVMLPLWNVYHFFALYANAANNGEGYSAKLKYDSQHVMDRFILGKTRELIEQALLGQAQITDNGAPPRTRPDLADTLLAPQDGAPTTYTHRASSQVSWNPEGAPGAQRPDGRVRAGVTVARVGAEPPEAAAGLWITIPG